MDLLNNWFDKDLPVESLIETATSVKFILFLYSVEINFNIIQDPTIINWVLQADYKSAKGYEFVIRINQLTDIKPVSDEFLIFTEILKQVNCILEKSEWDYLAFTGLPGQRNKIPEAIAQRLTKLQPNVERIASRNHVILITKF